MYTLKSIFFSLCGFAFILIMINCSGGTIPPIVPDDGGDDGNNNPPPVVNNGPNAWFAVSPEERTYSQGQSVLFDATPSSDPDNDTLTYEWDFHHNDSTFNLDATGPSLNYELPSFGSVVAMLRVSDSKTPPLSSTFRRRLNVKPTGEVTNITNGQVSDFTLRRAVESNGSFYALYTGTVNSDEGVYVQRSSDNGKIWGEPVRVSSDSNDIAPWGVWMDSASFGIAVGWMARNGEIRYSKGEASGVDSVTFSTPVAVGSTSVTITGGATIDEPVLYSVACSPDGSHVYFAYMTTAEYTISLISAALSNGEVTGSETIDVASATEDRFQFQGTSITVASTGRVFITYIWKSLGYDNADEVKLFYLDPPSTTLQGPIRVDRGLDGFVYDLDPLIIANNQGDPIVYFRTTGLYKGGRDIALCIASGNPPVFQNAIRGNNTLGTIELAAQNSPSVAFDRDHNQLWLAFEDFRDKLKLSEIYMTMFDKSYSTILPDFDISDDPAMIYSDINPQVCFRSGTSPAIVVVWERDGTDLVAYHAEY